MAVAGSAFNPVKIEAALAVVGAIGVAALSERLIGGGASFLLLAGYGLAAGGWIAWRSWQVLARRSLDPVPNSSSIQSTGNNVVSNGRQEQ